MSAISDTAAAAPPGAADWTVIERGGPFARFVGPIYLSRADLEPEEPARFGFRVRDEHCNPRRVCHGGMLATFLDVALACAVREQPEVIGPLPTISMTVDYLAPAACGAWIESRVRIPRLGRQIVFAEARLMGPGGPVLRGSGCYVRARPDRS